MMLIVVLGMFGHVDGTVGTTQSLFYCGQYCHVIDDEIIESQGGLRLHFLPLHASDLET